MNFIEALKTRWVVWVWNHTPTCAEMARLTSLSLDQPPTLKTRLQMALHFLICAWCERYHKHLKFLHRAAPRLSEHPDAAFARDLSPEAKERIKGVVRRLKG